MRAPLLLASAALALAACGPPVEGQVGAEKVPPGVLAQLRDGLPVQVLVQVTAPDEGGQALGGWAQRLPTPAERAAALAALERTKADALSAAPPGGAEVLRAYPQLPLLLVRLAGLDALWALAARPEVVRLHEDEVLEASLAESLPLIHQPTAAAAGKTGAGTSVAVLDTGLDYRGAAFGSCTAPGVPASCKVAFAQDFAADDGALDANSHGTNVAGIVLGVAPGAKVLALDVFTGSGAYTSDIVAAIDWVVAHQATYAIASLNLSLGGGSSTTPCAGTAFAVAITSAKNAGVLSAVASGNNGWSNQISHPACSPDAVSVGAVYDAAVGARGWSLCTDATTAADRVTCFSNSASFVTLLAPGSTIVAAGISMSGTSQAAPHVAGAIAVLAGAFPAETPQQRLDRLVSTGVPVTDARNGLTLPRLDVAAAAFGCAASVSPPSATTQPAGGTLSFTVATGADCAWTATSDAAWAQVTSAASATGSGTVTVSVDQSDGAARSTTLHLAGKSVALTQAADSVAPTGTVTIAGGAAATRVAAVTLTLSASDASGVAQLCVSNTATCTAWTAFATSKAWTLAAGSGPKTVRAWFKDARGNVSAPVSATIVLDTLAPTGGLVTASGASGRVTLTWSGFADAHTGVASYVAVWAPTRAPANCSTGSPLYQGPLSTVVAVPLTNGVTYGFRVCAVDGVGNLSLGAEVTGRPAPEYVAPTGAVLINGGAAWTRTAAVTLSLSAADASGVAKMCVSNSASCTTWEDSAATRTWSLAAGSGARTVSVSFMDAYGNVSAPAQDGIGLDAVPPANGQVSVLRLSGQLSLSWTGFADATSGLASYRVVAAVGTAPATCASGRLVMEGSATTVLDPGLTDGTTYGYRVCAVDLAGNVSTGAVATGVPAPEFTPPSGAVLLAGGAASTRTAVVAVALSASDASGVTQLCLSNTASCTAWVAFAPSATWTLAAGNGTRTVFAFFKDGWGNVSSAASDSITLDTAAPTGGAVTIAPGSQKVVLLWSGFADALSGVASYTLVSAVGAAPPNCSSGTVLYAGLGTAFQHTGLTAGTTYGYRLCATDRAGNTSAGLAKVAVPTP